MNKSYTQKYKQPLTFKVLTDKKGEKNRCPIFTEINVKYNLYYLF